MSDTLEEQCTEDELAARAERKAKRNTERFREIAALIEKYPERHNQDTWMGGFVDERELDLPESGTTTVRACGTTQCVAGWAIVLDEENYLVARGGSVKRADGRPFVGWTWEGSHALGLTVEEGELLFHTYRTPPMGWPRALRAIGEGVAIGDALNNEVPNCGCETD
jgi:hypothetical protein